MVDEKDQKAKELKPSISSISSCKSEMDEMVEKGVDMSEMEADTRFSFRYLLKFLGPGFLMSIAYLDPGNIEADLESGSMAGFGLAWVLLLAHLLGLLLQRLSARLGVVTGKHMAEVAHDYYAKVPRIILWLMIEVAIIGADMQEVIGTAIAFTLLSNNKIPLWAGVLITVIDSLTFLFLDKFGFRKLEFFFCFLIATMAVTFGTEYIIMAPPQAEVLDGIFVPQCPNCNVDMLLRAVGIIGSVIMPHNLYLHSALVKTRKVDRTKPTAIKRANMYFFIESALALLCSFIINLFVTAVFAQGVSGKTNSDIREMCILQEDAHFDVFENNTNLVDIDIYKGGIFLGCAFGAAAMYVWAIGILAAGQSSTMTCCYTGQFVMEGFLNISWSRWKRVLFTRSIAIVPALIVAIFQDIQHLGLMNDLLNALQLMQIPFALLPILTFTCSKSVMQNFRTGTLYRIFLAALSVLLICINIFFLYDFVLSNAPNTWYMFIALGLFTVLYLSFVAYLAFYCIVAMIGKDTLLSCARTIFPLKEDLNIDFPWLEQAKPKPEEGSESSSLSEETIDLTCHI